MDDVNRTYFFPNEQAATAWMAEQWSDNPADLIAKLRRARLDLGETPGTWWCCAPSDLRAAVLRLDL